jgi:hypothetical protein
MNEADMPSGNVIFEELLREASEKGHEYCDKIPFEFYWDFAGIDKDFIKETIIFIFMDGYIEATRKKDTSPLS